MNSQENIFDSKVLGHPSALFVLFFTEMWERFSYYGMRAILVLFLVSSIGLGGWDWPREHALALYGTYTALVYLTPILGGWLADRYLGYRNSVAIGALIMTLGHASMAMEFANIFMYLGIALLIVGNGFFKPNMTSIISELYKNHQEKKDGAFTIFYMGVNAGAFLGILMCGYLGEKVGWSYGFGLAGIFMFLGWLQFSLASNIFGETGKRPKKESAEDAHLKLEFEGDAFNPFTMMDKMLIAISTILGLIWVINDPASKIGGTNILEFSGNDYSNQIILIAVSLFFILLVSRIVRYPKIIRDRLLAVVIFCVLIIFFWASFEQAGGSMTIFAKDYTNRVMSGGWATAFLIINTLIIVVPVGIITWVLYLLFKQTYKKYLSSNIVLGTSFVLIWGIVIWMLNRDLNSSAFIISYDAVQIAQIDETTGTQKIDEAGNPIFIEKAVTESTQILPDDNIIKKEIIIIEPLSMESGSTIHITDVDKRGNFIYVADSKLDKMRASIKSGEESSIVPATVVRVKENELEIPATWFLILNSLFIIIFAPLFSNWWESRYNPSGAVKYALGLILLGLGFAALAFGSLGIESGAKVASVSMIWLVLAYLFHTLGELCLSPVSLSYISKLVPGRMIAMMFGIYYIAIAVGNKLAGTMGSKIDQITEQYSMSGFFFIFTIVPIAVGIVAILLNGTLKRLMHGVR
jgi:proton-dependent oligopeptide transporter, POT family